MSNKVRKIRLKTSPHTLEMSMVFGKARELSKRFPTKEDAEEYANKLQARIAEVLEEFDCDIWTICERVYECRRDCMFGRLVTA